MKKVLIKFGAFALSASLLFGMSSCDEDDNSDVQAPAAPSVTIADIAAGDANFSILVDALTRTNLLATVSDENADLTVFAPTNAAFSDLLTELGLADLDAVEQALGNDGLRDVLLYHVLGAEVMSMNVETGYVATSATNSTDDAYSMYISTNAGVRINDRANVTTADVDASNGVVHIIDKVILPMTAGDLIIVNPDFSSLVTALTVADGDLDDVVTDPEEDHFTLFAPNNDAFAALVTELNAGDLNGVVAAVGTDGLADILVYHLVDGNINSDEVPSGVVTMANGDDVTISTSNGVTLTDERSRVSTVILTDVQGTNGVAHVIDKVVLPAP